MRELRRVLLERQVLSVAFDLRLQYMWRKAMESTAHPIVCHRHELHPCRPRVVISGTKLLPEGCTSENNGDETE
jgi:hypothetical protein